jgi:hypothetical protein
MFTLASKGRFEQVDRVRLLYAPDLSELVLELVPIVSTLGGKCSLSSCIYQSFGMV